VSDVKAGVKHVIADVIAKDLPTREALRNRVSNSAVWESKESRSKKQEKGDGKKEKGKYEDYYKFCAPVQGIKSHQVIVCTCVMKPMIL
jgi:transcriptional accessory protein Tex/SPT6